MAIQAVAQQGETDRNAATQGPSGSEVRLVGLARYYGEVGAVRGIDLTIARGEFVTLLGPSGSGKTTTLMMIAGFTQPSAGDVLIGNRSVVNLPPERRNIGVVFQSYALFPHMSVFDNVAFPLKMRRTAKPEIRSRVEEALTLVRLTGMSSRRIQQLSGGQQQRVALARALVFHPPLLLMDEPLGALDRKLREQMQFEIKRIQAALGLTVVYVTHDQGEALVMSDRIAIMNDGLLLQIGPPAELYERPSSAFVADFLGESNGIDGEVVESATDEVVVALDSCNAQVRGIVSGPLSGPRVRVMVRPEVIDVAPAGHAGGDNVLAGVVEEAIYLGQAIRYIIRVQGIVLSANVAHRPGGPMYAPGTEVAAVWATTATMVLPGEEPG